MMVGNREVPSPQKVSLHITGVEKRIKLILGASMASNTFLNWMFIFGNLGAPRLAEQGAALATLLARVLSCSIAVGWAILDKQFKLSPALLFRPGGEMTRRFIRFSTPVMCNETFWGAFKGAQGHHGKHHGEHHGADIPCGGGQAEQRVEHRDHKPRRRGMSRKIFGKVLHSLPGGAILISVIAISLTMEQNFLEVEPSCL